MAWKLRTPTTTAERRMAATRLTIARIQAGGGFTGAPIQSEVLYAVKNDPQALRHILSTITASTASSEEKAT